MTVLERTELVLPEPAHALAALLGVSAPELADGAPLPLLWHWLYLLDRPATRDLGPDGHPIRNVVPVPPAAGLRRMFAGGRCEIRGPLRCLEPATRRTEVVNTAEKAGRSGPLIFVTVRTEISQRDRVVVHEEQDILYRTPARLVLPDATPAGPNADDWPVDTTPHLLFRFSALTYNGHRIHYDRDYARDIEGYPGLVVHGPLQALLMSEWARAHRPEPPRRIDYRLVSPAFDVDGLVVGKDTAVDGDTDGTALTLRTRAGRRTATARVS
jgi:3-methylfumaryl-CoA hydratase